MPIVKKATKKVAVAPAKKAVKKVAPAAKKAVKTVAPMTPSERMKKMHAARAAGKTAGKKTVTRKPMPSWKLPTEFKRAFYEVQIRTDKDGMPSNAFKMTRFQGRYDPKADDKKKFDVKEYDLPTYIGIVSRMSLVLFHATGRPNSKGVPSRLAPNTVYIAVIAVGKKGEPAILNAAVKQVFVLVKSAKTGKMLRKELLKTDPAYRKIRKVNRYLSAAFKDAVLPPKKTRVKRQEADEE